MTKVKTIGLLLATIISISLAFSIIDSINNIPFIGNIINITSEIIGLSFLSTNLISFLNVDKREEMFNYVSTTIKDFITEEDLNDIKGIITSTKDIVTTFIKNQFGENKPEV
jgi:hypothetical protein